jgi:hypothetical protein
VRGHIFDHLPRQKAENEADTTPPSKRIFRRRMLATSAGALIGVSMIDRARGAKFLYPS